MREFGSLVKKDNNGLHVEDIIQSFRDYYCDKGYLEIARKPLVSQHDPSIRFTNSTSSVMKPYFTDGRKISSRIMLVQPALGFQGINIWNKQRKIGNYSSYFLSFGIMSPYEELDELVNSSLLFFKNSLKINMNHFYIHVRSTDMNLCHSFQKVSSCHICKDYFEDKYYIHRFGIEGMRGKTACYTIKKEDSYQYIGSVIILEQDGRPVGIEHSFDSTLLMSAIKEKGHPVLEMSGAAFCNQLLKDELQIESRLALIDLLNVSIVLTMEGLKAGSRGRSGNLRNVIELASQLVKENDIYDKVSLAIIKIAEEEKEMRKKLPGKNIEIVGIEELNVYLKAKIERFQNGTKA